MRIFLLIIAIISLISLAIGQAGRANRQSSEAFVRLFVDRRNDPAAATSTDNEEIRIQTDLVMMAVRISHRGDAPVANLAKTDFRLYENGREQAISYFAGIDEPFTVALLIDVSYSTVFKIGDLKEAARAFVRQLAPPDRVAIIAFDKKPSLLLRPSNNRRAAELAIDSLKTGSGTSLFDALDLAFRQIADFRGRKAIVLLTDGVDTSSQLTNAKRLQESLSEEDIIIYAIRYDTFRDVDKLRKRDAEIRYDKNDRPLIFSRPPQIGERDIDYKAARDFLYSASDYTGGKVFEAQRVKDLSRSFSEIANELHKTYILGYYPSEDREPAREYIVKIRILRPKLLIEVRRRLRIR
ncbi:MAG: hypothetical protein C4325_09995 [Blastocatellia bacterium]